MRFCKISNLFNRVPKYQKIFQKTFPYICNDCGEFTYNQYEFCEKCGAENSVRKAMIEDYTKYYLKKEKEKEKSRSERILSDDQPENLKLLAFLFTFFLIFLTFEIPFLINNLLIQIFPDIHPAIDPDEIEVFINGVRPIGYICLIIIVIFIILGFLIKKEKISVSSSFLLFLPTFGSFASSMFFLAGIGILEVVWLPLDTPYFNFLTLGIIVFPIYLLVFLFYLGPIGYILLYFFLILPWIFVILGLYIFTSGVISWFYGKYQKIDIIEFSIYKYSRHPQYLGFLIWSYGLFLHYMISELYFVSTGGLEASLPWVIFALIIVSIAFLEDINLSKKHPDKYAEYRKRTPFLIKLPKTLNLIVSFPLRYILKKDFPETNKDILKVVIFYGMIIIILSLLILLMFPLFYQ